MGGLKFILPDWDDIVDPGYDFVREEHSERYRRDKYVGGARVWDLLGNVVDGVLVSISTISKGKMSRIMSAGGVKGFLRLPDSMQVIGDCGAWQYRDLPKPPYSVTEVMDYYERLGVDYGVTLDHIPFFGNPQERLELTMSNAVEMYRLWRGGSYRFILLASVQGIEIEDYIKSLERLYAVGYRYFAIGGLARRDTDFIRRLVNAITEFARSRRDIDKVHFLGITRLSVIPLLRGLLNYVDEVSFDSSTPLRIAWTRAEGNYLTVDGRAYTAIRVPTHDEDAHRVLEVLRQYDTGAVDLGEVVEALRRYLARIGHLHYLPHYEALLRDKPWKTCDCAICKAVGIDVVVFRGNDRNRRRGFHNVYVVSQLIRSGRNVRFRVVRDDVGRQGGVVAMQDGLVGLLRGAGRVLIITNCTAEKNVDWGAVLGVLRGHGLGIPSFDIEREEVYRRVLGPFVKPAREMYGGSFTAVRNLADRLRSLGKQVDLYILSARYGLIREDTPIIPYEATLKGMSREQVMQWGRRMRVEQEVGRLIGNYDLVIVVMPREYAMAMGNALNKLLSMENAVLILPKTVLGKAKDTRAKLLMAGSLTARLRQIKQLMQALNNGKTTLDQWLTTN